MRKQSHDPVTLKGFAILVPFLSTVTYHNWRTVDKLKRGEVRVPTTNMIKITGFDVT
jgi:hypothetical protein